MDGKLYKKKLINVFRYAATAIDWNTGKINVQ